MSHFSVMVIGPENEEALREALAPFQENNMGDCPREFMEFEDVEDKYYQEYISDSVERIWDSRSDERFFLHEASSRGLDHSNLPPGVFKVNTAFQDLYPTFEKFMDEWVGYKARDLEKGRYGRWENPNCKWDWWQLGGRWAGYLLVKPNTREPGFGRGAPSLLMNEDPYEGNALRVDAARNGDIDWEGMMKANAS